MRRWWALTAVVLLAGAAAANDSEEPSLDVQLSAEQIHVGDVVEAEIRLTHGSWGTTDAPHFPEWGERWGDAEIRRVDAPARSERGSGAAIWSQTVAFTIFRPGRFTLPPPVASLGRADTEAVSEITPESPIVVTVASVLPTDEGEISPQPPSPPRSMPWGEPFWWAACSLAAACLIGLAFLLLRGEAAEERGEIAADPLQDLLHALHNLRREQNPVHTATGLSMVLRRYLGAELSFPAIESTTTEIQRRLRKRNLPDGFSQATDSVLRACDGIKFARREVTSDELAAQLSRTADAARTLDDHLRAQRAPELTGDTA